MNFPFLFELDLTVYTKTPDIPVVPVSVENGLSMVENILEKTRNTSGGGFSP